MVITGSKKLIHRFRMVGIAEGISFLVLLLIAMPIKHFLKIPQPVKYIGWVHGALFIAYIYLLVEMAGEFKKDFSWCAKSFFAAFIPFGTFLTDKKLKREEAEM